MSTPLLFRILRLAASQRLVKFFLISLGRCSEMRVLGYIHLHNCSELCIFSPANGHVFLIGLGTRGHILGAAAGCAKSIYGLSTSSSYGRVAILWFTHLCHTWDSPPPPQLCTKVSEFAIHFVLMWKQETKGGGLRTAVAPALLLVSNCALGLQVTVNPTSPSPRFFFGPRVNDTSCSPVVTIAALVVARVLATAAALLLAAAEPAPAPPVAVKHKNADQH